MSQALAEPTAVAPCEAELTFDQLYSSSRDDVYAYAAIPPRARPRRVADIDHTRLG